MECRRRRRDDRSRDETLRVRSLRSSSFFFSLRGPTSLESLPRSPLPYRTIHTSPSPLSVVVVKEGDNSVVVVVVEDRTIKHSPQFNHRTEAPIARPLHTTTYTLRPNDLWLEVL